MLEFLIEIFGIALEIAESILARMDIDEKSKRKQALAVAIAILVSLLLVAWGLLTILHISSLVQHKPLIPLAVVAWLFLTAVLVPAVVWGVCARRNRKKNEQPPEDKP